MNKVIIPFADTSCKIPLMEFTLSGKNYVALLDTGSESTLFDKNINESEDFKKSDTEYQMSLIGKHLDVSAVLGSDMLKKLGAKIDYRRQQLTIKR